MAYIVLTVPHLQGRQFVPYVLAIGDIYLTIFQTLE